MASYGDVLYVAGRAAIIVASCLLLLVIAIVGFYYVYWKPKQRQEEQLIARELYDNGKSKCKLLASLSL